MSASSPQNYRIFSAPIVSLSTKLALWLILASFLLINIYYRLTTIAFWQTNQRVLTSPLSSQEHVRKAQDAWTNNDWQRAKNELLVAQSLLKNSAQDARINILGASTTPLDLLNQWQREPVRLTDEEHFWQTVISQKIDYRDAYIQLSALNYQLNNDKKALSYLDSARSLDPNSLYVQKLSGILHTEGK